MNQIRNEIIRVNSLAEKINSFGIKKLLIVAGHSFFGLPIKNEILSLPCELVFFHGFKPNPSYEDIIVGVDFARKEKIDGILAVGGGSAIDVAKCIKLYYYMDDSSLYLQQSTPANVDDIKLFALPTTAGTGSESTRYAVIYYEGKKQSVHDYKIIPEYVVFSPECLVNLPIYQKQCTFLDAMCQAMESIWSVNATEESQDYAVRALDLLMKWEDAYFTGKDEENYVTDVCENILLGANLAGRAINISQTTAAHAMSYNITSRFGIPHGGAVALCFLPLWKKTLEIAKKDNNENLLSKMDLIAESSFGVLKEEFYFEFKAFLKKLNISCGKMGEQDILEMSKTVNPVRLKNHPVTLTKLDFETIYGEMKNEK